MEPAFVDVQGFMLQKIFVPKEFAIIQGPHIQHFIFKEPYPFSLLTEREKLSVDWFIWHHHGLSWSAGQIPYLDHYQIIPMFLKNFDVVYTKSAWKAVWFNNLQSERIVQSLDEMFYFQLREKINKGTVIESCAQHKGICALKNVFIYQNEFYSNEYC